MARSLECRSPGFTLVELLLSVAIAAVVVALLASLFASTARTVEGQEARTKDAPAAMDVLDRLRDDIGRAFFPEQDDACVPVLVAEPLSFSFCTVRPPRDATDWRWSETWHVEYRTEPDPAASGLRLVCVESPATGPGSEHPVTNTVIGAIDRVAVELFDGAEWRTAWPPEGKPVRPAAARIQLVAGRFKGQQAWTTEVLIPAGLAVTSGVTRTVER